MKYLTLITTVTTLALIACQTESEYVLPGYIEGEYLYIAPTTSGILNELSVQRGQQIRKGDPLFALDDTELKANVASAESEITQAQAHLNDLLKGQRPEKIDVILKQLEASRATLKDATQDYERARGLVNKGLISRSVYDDKETTYKVAKAKTEEIEAQLTLAKLGAREDEIEVARAELNASKQQLIRAMKQLEDASPKAPADAYIENTFFRKDEFIPAGRPVVSLLPPSNVKVRFFVDQNRLPQIKRGNKATITYKDNGQPIPAKISFISSQAEYTPPMIYSTNAHTALVYMVEALPDTVNKSLHPGLPVSISIKIIQ